MYLKDKHVFIVEDSLQNRIVFQLTLIKHGAQIYFERWGSDALVRLRELRQVDIIVLDLMLARGVSGYDIFDEIRALPQYAHVPIVAVSATEPSIGIAKTQSKGFAGFIAKPIDDILFPRQLAAIISGEQVWYAGERHLQ